jgi:hypothetical protein
MLKDKYSLELCFTNPQNAGVSFFNNLTLQIPSYNFNTVPTYHTLISPKITIQEKEVPYKENFQF